MAAVPVCASRQTTTSRSGSGSWRPARTTSSPGRSTHREVEARVEALLLRFQRSKDLSPIDLDRRHHAGSRPRRIVAVYSPKGGVGTTTIATNIAVVGGTSAAGQGRARGPRPPVRWRRDATSTWSPSRPSPTSSVTKRRCANRSSCARTRCATTAGCTSWPPPPTPEAAELITPDHVAQIIAHLLEGYDSIIIDAGSTLDERTMQRVRGRRHGPAAGLPGDLRPQGDARLAGLPQRGRLDRDEGDVRAEQHVRAGDPQAARHRGGPGHADHDGPAVRPVPLPQGRQRGRCRSCSAPRSRQPPSGWSSSAIGVRSGRVTSCRTPADEKKGGLFGRRRR